MAKQYKINELLVADAQKAKCEAKKAFVVGYMLSELTTKPPDSQAAAKELATTLMQVFKKKGHGKSWCLPPLLERALQQMMA